MFVQGIQYGTSMLYLKNQNHLFLTQNNTETLIYPFKHDPHTVVRYMLDHLLLPKLMMKMMMIIVEDEGNVVAVAVCFQKNICHFIHKY